MSIKINSNISDNCIFYTNKIHKKPHHSKKYISEIVSYTPLLNNEITNVNTIKHRISDYKNHFFVYSDYHKIKKRELNDNVEYNNSDNNEIFYENIISQKDDGEYLFKFENKQCIYFKDYLKSLSSSRKYIFQLIHYYKYLLDGIQKLVSINIVHGNIQINNIIIVKDNDTSDKVCFTDFRNSIEIQNDSKNKIPLLHLNNIRKLNMYNPIEFYLISYMLTRKVKSLSQYNIHILIERIFKEEIEQILKPFGDTVYDEYVNEAKEYYSKYVNKTIEDIWSDMCIWYFSWDNYSLSVVYLNILIGLHKYLINKIQNEDSESNINEKNNIIKNRFLISFMKLLVTNIHPNPNKRKTNLKTLEIFDNIIYSCDSGVYTDLIKYI
jgi:hypothetical protein